MALILVLLVLGALALIATPFVISMLVQERISQLQLHAQKAGSAAEAIKNFAVCRLYHTHDFYERVLRRPPFNNPYVDTLAELFINLGELEQPFALRDPSGRLCGIHVQDEQGKINIFSAPQQLLKNIRDIVDTRIARLRDFVTLYSVRDCEWILPQTILDISQEGFVRVGTYTFLGQGTKILVTKVGMRPLRCKVQWDLVSGHMRMRTEPVIPVHYIGGTIRIENRHPVNINTASVDVLTAIFMGLRYSKRERISYAKAREIAQRLHRIRNFEGFADLREAILSMPIEDPIKQAVLLNARHPTHIALGGTGTLPFTFKATEIFTLDILSCFNNPTGEQVALEAFKEVIQLTPPQPGVRWRLESQKDFEDQRRIFPNPFIMTSPAVTAIGHPADASLKPNNAYLQLAPAEEPRALPTRERFKNTLEGIRLGSAYTRKWREFFPMSWRAASIMPGGLEMWIRFDTPPQDQEYLIDIREGEFENRLSLQYNAGQLILTAKDAGLERKLAQLIRPFKPTTDTWYHIGVYWHSTLHQGLTLLVDGMSHPDTRFTYVDDQGNSLSSPLKEPLPGDPEDPNFERLLFDAQANLPPEGTLLVGTEVIEYQDNFKRIKRGARGTRARSHPAGTLVTPFGYSVYLMERLPTGGATLTQGLGANTVTKILETVDQSKTEIPVRAESTQGFPGEGYLRIGAEVLYYSGIRREKGTKPRDVFTGCKRAQLGTSTRVHYPGARVQLFSLKVDSNLGYNPQGIIRVQDEWFKVQRVGKHWFTGLVVKGNPQSFRGYLTPTQSHTPGAKVIPVFRVADWVCRGGDRVTIIDRKNNKELHTIHSSRGFYVSFQKNVHRVYQPDIPHTRLLKFPSGELLSTGWTELKDPVLKVAGPGRTLDELGYTYFKPMPFIILARDLDQQDTEAIGTFCRLPRYLTKKEVEQLIQAYKDWGTGTSGVIQIGKELIGFGLTEQGRLLYIKRGFANSPIQAHQEGQRILFIPPLKVLPLGSDLPAQGSSGIPSSAYQHVLINQEVLLLTPQDGKILRGRFGTPIMDHVKNDLIYFIPFRFLDTYQRAPWNPKMAYFQASKSVKDAIWRYIYWEEEIPQQDPHLRTHLLIRIDERVPWGTPSSRHGPIYEFWGGNLRHILGLPADRVQLRFLFEYLEGSFYPSDSWKRATRITDVRLNYKSDTKVLFHEE